eukprot:jgi/Chrzof1/13073/Cz07g18250.t1
MSFLYRSVHVEVAAFAEVQLYALLPAASFPRFLVHPLLCLDATYLQMSDDPLPLQCNCVGAYNLSSLPACIASAL